MTEPGQNGRLRVTTGNFITSALVVVGFAVQWGIFANQIGELTRRISVLEEKIDNRLLSRDEFEKRHRELERRVEVLEEESRQWGRKQ